MQKKRKTGKRNRIHGKHFSLCLVKIDAVKTVRITFIYTHQGDCVWCIFFRNLPFQPTTVQLDVT